MNTTSQASIFCKMFRTLLLLLSFVFGRVFSQTTATTGLIQPLTPDYDDLFWKWTEEFGVKFQSAEHHEHVFRSWVDNHLFIERSNRLNSAFQLGHNQFSGLNSTEFVNWIRGGNPVQQIEYNRYGGSERYNANGLSTLPSSVDWTLNGAVTPVKDQGQCGSCWSFSTTGALEGAYAIKNGKLLSFSEQQLVDCDTLGNGGKDHGCNGGLMDYAFTWIGKNNGLCLESDYPYVSGTTKTAGSCAKTCKNVAGTDITKYVDVESGSDSAFMAALAQQPVSVAIEADQREFQLYKSGILTSKCGTNLDHGVLAVGYGTEGGVDYYKIKNSWSTTWGDKGYIRIGRGSQYNNGDGQCGVLLEASYPLV